MVNIDGLIYQNMDANVAVRPVAEVYQWDQ
jgi:(2Fe-2S) ferredoxin